MDDRMPHRHLRLAQGVFVNYTPGHITIGQDSGHIRRLIDFTAHDDPDERTIIYLKKMPHQSKLSHSDLFNAIQEAAQNPIKKKDLISLIRHKSKVVKND